MTRRMKNLLLKIGAKFRREGSNTSVAECKYSLLSPTLLEEQEAARYSNEFDFALTHQDARNIALSGPYGAGKSSVARTIEAKETTKGKVWTHISLADFKGVSTERSVEDEILSQLVYKVPPKALSKSALKPLRDEPPCKDLLRTALLILFGLDTAFLAYEARHGITLSLPFASPELIFAIATTTWCLLAGYAIYREIRTKSISRTFKRLKMLNAEVELFDGDSDTALDKYMDDIVYVLKNSQIDAIVFEDIDRFGNLTVFEKLRRINDLSNEGRSSTLRFLYLIKDSLFDEPHDRTKFFDFIIPIIPFVDPSNSVNLLKRGLKAGGLEVDEAFLYQLSSFVDDPRILTEICNESIHYRDFLFPEDEISKHSPEKLVGIVSYKVIFPEDYENLQRRRGYVKSLFDKKDRLIDSLLRQNQDEIDKCQEELRRIGQNLALNENELQLLYLSTLPDFRDVCAYQRYNTNSPTEPSQWRESLRQDSRIDQMLERIENSDTKYTDRLKEIRRSSDAASAIYRRRIEALKNRSPEYARMKLSDLIEESADRETFFMVSPKELARGKDYDEFAIGQVMTSRYFPLIRFLVSQGWLDETYPRYMSHIYPDSILPSDLDFVNSVLGAGPPQPEYEIANSRAVVIRLDDKAISRSSARNYSLLASLLSSDNEQMTKAMLRGVGHDRDGRFIAGFLSSDHFNQSAFSLLDEIYPAWAIDVIADSAITDSQKTLSLRHAFAANNLPSAIADNAQEVGEYISVLSDFPSAPISNPQRFAESLAKVPYNPNDIDVNTCDDCVLGKIIELGMYVPNANLVSKLVSWKQGQRNPIPLSKLNEALCREENRDIRERALRDINDYIGSLVSSAKESLHDGDEAVLMILGADGLSASACNGYVSSLDKPIHDLSKVTSDEFARIIIEQRKLKATTTNLLNSYSRLGFEASLRKFISKCGKIEADAPNIEDATTKKLARNLLECCLTDASLNINTIANVARSFKCSFSELSLPASTPQAIAELIDLHVLEVTKQNLTSVRDTYPTLAVRLAMCDLEAYIDLVCGTEAVEEQCAFVAAEAIEIFENPSVDAEQKAKIAEALDEKIPLKASYPDEVNIRLIERDLYDSFDSLIPLYKHGSKPLKESIASEVESRPDDFAEIALPDDLETRLMQSPRKESRADLVDLAARRIRALGRKGNRAGVQSILQKACLTNYVKLIEGPSSMIHSTVADDYLLEVLSALEMCGAISSEVNDRGMRRVSSLGYRRKRTPK